MQISHKIVFEAKIKFVKGGSDVAFFRTMQDALTHVENMYNGMLIKSARIKAKAVILTNN